MSTPEPGAPPSVWMTFWEQFNLEHPAEFGALQVALNASETTVAKRAEIGEGLESFGIGII